MTGGVGTAFEENATGGRGASDARKKKMMHLGDNIQNTYKAVWNNEGTENDQQPIKQ